MCGKLSFSLLLLRQKGIIFFPLYLKMTLKHVKVITGLFLQRSHAGVGPLCSSCFAVSFTCVYEGVGWHYSRGRSAPRPCMNPRRMGWNKMARFWETKQGQGVSVHLLKLWPGQRSASVNGLVFSVFVNQRILILLKPHLQQAESLQLKPRLTCVCVPTCLFFL